LAPKKIYTRRNLDLEPIASVADLVNILHKNKEKESDSGVFLNRNLSFPKDGVKSIDDLDFDIEFEHTLFRSKLDSKLTEILFDEKKFQSFISVVPIQIVVIPSQISQPVYNPPRTMVARYAPLFLPTQFHDLPQNYNHRIKSHDAE
jgi:hypothetical protein